MLFLVLPAAGRSGKGRRGVSGARTRQKQKPRACATATSGRHGESGAVPANRRRRASHPPRLPQDSEPSWGRTAAAARLGSARRADECTTGSAKRKNRGWTATAGAPTVHAPGPRSGCSPAAMQPPPVTPRLAYVTVRVATTVGWGPSCLEADISFLRKAMGEDGVLTGKWQRCSDELAQISDLPAPANLSYSDFDRSSQSCWPWLPPGEFNDTKSSHERKCYSQRLTTQNPYMSSSIW